MARMHVMERSEEQQIMDELHAALGRRLAVSSLAPCPVEFTMAFVDMCSTQSCGKCTPCRVGLRTLRHLLSDVLNGSATMDTLTEIERLSRSVYLSADCAIGFEAGAMALRAVKGFHDDFMHHITRRSCGFEQSSLVPCVSGCPAGVDIPGYIALVAAGRNTDAVRLIRKDNPLPLVCGLVCEHPCEINCRRGMIDDPMNIRAIKRYACEHMEGSYMPRMAEGTGKEIAVVGGGPAGLSCAYYLTLMGHHVTILEQRKHLGGMLRYGIPAYRLPREQLDGEIQWILGRGIDVVRETRVTDIAALRDAHDAVYIAIGAHADRKLGLDGEDAEGVASAVDMLRAIGDDETPDFSGQRVCIIGGGNVAMDAARSSVRCGADKVTIVYRRRVADMTAQDEEIGGAEAEGCELLQLNAPVRIETDEAGAVCGLVVQPQVIGAFKGGRPAPRPADASEVTLPCERVIVAIGQAIDSAPFEEGGFQTKHGRFVTKSDASALGFDDVYVGGDCQSGPATVIRAINAGKIAAGNIDNYLGFNHKIELDFDIPPIQFRDVGPCGRSETTLREADERVRDFDEIEVGLSKEEVMQEASRCLHCDHFGYGAFRGGRVFEW
ncbi:NAD(P)-binding protein [Olsenella profusa]|uniref:Pyridine nucleotide-disulfide oxidoreductase n=1 Tax=Olsenella profusa F0195 TaxID=1125712 RepID=U2V6L9_9ACTN|nr:NAD(P)-binding protein [Olsenella profusa]ERL08261.1 pyridine nucleotide-disulfide oxidoreductase [Olsenella profusa F0195]